MLLPSPAWRWVAFLAAPVVAYAPLVPELARSPYGFRVAEAWGAMGFLLFGDAGLLALSALWMGQALAKGWVRGCLAALVIVPAGVATLVAWPYLPAALNVLEVNNTGKLVAPQLRMLIDSYLHAFSGASWDYHTWLVFAVVLVAAFGVSALGEARWRRGLAYPRAARRCLTPIGRQGGSPE